MYKALLSLGILSLGASSVSADLVAHFPMDVNSSEKLTENVSGALLKYKGNFAPENVSGVVGKALRFDGYSTYVYGDSRELGTLETMTASLWVAPETYPVIKLDTPTDEKIVLAGNIDHNAKTGWSFTLGINGNYAFECYCGGWKISAEAPGSLPKYRWSNLTATFDAGAQKVILYLNGEKVAETKGMTGISNPAAYYFGKGFDTVSQNNFMLNTFNGLLDDLEVYNKVLEESEIAKRVTSEIPDLSIPSARFEKDKLRPRFHGMPAANWTNECHGLVYSDGKYHVFFQKNANGPYMTRLHWGHISSPDLVNWTEEKIAFGPDTDYDIKGCWSGCVFTDDVITNGKPSAIYTAVDYARAVIAQANPTDESLVEWTKVNANPIINGRPQGLTDDFRDPYFFRNGDDAYIIVGSSKDDIGVATLHKYNPSSGTWTNDGALFAKGDTQAKDGKFWEMPNVTKMDNGKWLFTVTPLETNQGVKVLYRVGTIGDDGKFTAETQPEQVELISRDGYGLLSPSIYQKDGRTLAMGIVPDKLPGSENARLGWAHCYSFPREWRLDADNKLVQCPAHELEALRSDISFAKENFNLNGEEPLSNVSGRQVEVLAKFEVGNSSFGINLLQNEKGACRLYYNPATRSITVDMTELNRTSNDDWSYKGVYSATLPEAIPVGGEMKLNVFLDGSILDIFINDKWATSVRVFPKDKDADGVSIYADGPTKVKELKGWVLSAEGSTGGVDDILDNGVSNGPVNVYSITGSTVRRDVEPATALDGLAPGIYIVSGKKHIVK